MQFIKISMLRKFVAQYFALDFAPFYSPYSLSARSIHRSNVPDVFKEVIRLLEEGMMTNNLLCLAIQCDVLSREITNTARALRFALPIRGMLLLYYL